MTGLLVSGCADGALAPSDLDGSTLPGADVGATPELDPIPARPVSIEPQLEFQGSTERLLDVTVAQVVPLPNNGVLAVTTGEIVRLAAGGDTAAAWELAVGQPVRMVAVDAEHALIAGSEGLFALDGEFVTASPLGALLGGSPVVSLLVVGENEQQAIWIATSDALYRWRDRRLVSIGAGELPVGNALLAYGAPYNDVPALWVASEGQLYALVGSDDGLLAYPERDDLAIDSLTADRIGQLWVVAGGGVHGRAPDGFWLWYDIGTPVRLGAGNTAARDLWFAGDDTLWHFRRGQARGDDISEAIDSRIPEFTVAASVVGVSGMEVDAAGRVMLATPDGLLRVSLGRPMVVDGLRAGDQLLDEVVTVRVYPARGDLLDELDARLDDAPLPVSEAPYEVLVDATAIEVGIHTLQLTARYRDDFEPVTQELFFTVGEVVTPGWHDDIEPLYDASCTPCHGSRGTAHQMDTPRAWEAEIVEILEAVRVGRMPLAPNPELVSEEIELIEGWLAGGFRE